MYPLSGTKGMKIIFFQKVNGCPVPYSLEDIDKWENIKENQITEHKVKGTTKTPSLKEHNLFMACCEFVANNTEDPYWNTKDKVKMKCKMVLHLVDDRFTSVWPDGQVNFVYKSLEFTRSPENGGVSAKERHEFYEQSFDLLAEKVDMYQDQLIEKAKAIMQDRWYRYAKKK